MKKILKYFSFRGTSKRAKFLQFILLAVIVWLLAAYVDEAFLAPNLCLINENWICYLPGEVREGVTLDKIASLLLLAPFIAVIVRRLNDHQVSPLFALLAVPAIGLLGSFLYLPEQPLPLWLLILCAILVLPLLYWMLTKGTKN